MEVGGLEPGGLLGATQNYDVPELREDFLALLVEQMKGQDPFSAGDQQGEFLSQMAQFSNLEQTQNLNQSILALVSMQSEVAALQGLNSGSALIGHEIEFLNEDGSTSSGEVQAVFMNSQGTFLRVDGKEVPMAALVEVRGKVEKPPAE